MALNSRAILDELVTYSKQTGIFGKVNTHEPDIFVASGNIVTAIWLQSVLPVPMASGLHRTTAGVTFVQRFYDSRTNQPQDMIDPEMLEAVDAMMNAYSGNFELGGNVRNVDLLGQTGIPLGCEAAYIEQQGEAVRVMDITIPLIVNDVWEQVR